MKHVSFETAKKLKEIGYPQPELSADQIWFTSGLTPFIVVKPHEKGFVLHYLSGKGWDIITNNDFDSVFYAPDASEILKQIQTDFSFYTVKLEYLARWGKYMATIDDPNSELNWAFYDENPHEVMARLYIQAKETFTT